MFHAIRPRAVRFLSLSIAASGILAMSMSLAAPPSTPQAGRIERAVDAGSFQIAPFGVALPSSNEPSAFGFLKFDWSEPVPGFGPWRNQYASAI